MIGSADNLFLFAKPVKYSEEQLEDLGWAERETVDFTYPDEFARRYREPMARLVGELYIMPRHTSVELRQVHSSW